MGRENEKGSEESEEKRKKRREGREAKRREISVKRRDQS